MTLLELIQQAARELKLQVPSTVIGNTDPNIQQLLSFLELEGKELRREFNWPRLRKEVSFTLVDGTANYALPTDWDSFIQDTGWDQSNRYPLFGPYSAEEWQTIKRSGISSSLRKGFTIKGAADSEFYLDPTPSSSTAGQIVSLEYISRNWIRPVAWSSGGNVTLGDYVWNNGVMYEATSGGVFSASAPTHTTGSASNGTATLDVSTDLYETFSVDTDVPLLDQELLKLGAKVRFREDNGFDTQALRFQYEAVKKRAKASAAGATAISLVAPTTPRRLGRANIPDTIDA